MTTGYKIVSHDNHHNSRIVSTIIKDGKHHSIPVVFYDKNLANREVKKFNRRCGYSVVAIPATDKECQDYNASNEAYSLAADAGTIAEAEMDNVLIKGKKGNTERRLRAYTDAWDETFYKEMAKRGYE